MLYQLSYASILLSTATPQAYRRARERLERVQESNPLPTTSSSFNPRYTLTFQNTWFGTFQSVSTYRIILDIARDI